MSETDKTAKTTNKATAWLITAFGEDIERCERNELWPSFVRKIDGQQEKCPTTGRIHYQGLAWTQQVRFSAMKKFLPKSHIEISKNPAACLNYVTKEESAVPGTRRTIHAVNLLTPRRTMEKMFATIRYFDDGELSQSSQEYWELQFRAYPKTYRTEMYKRAVSNCMAEDPARIRLWTNPHTQRMFELTFDYYYFVWRPEAAEPEKAEEEPPEPAVAAGDGGGMDPGSITRGPPEKTPGTVISDAEERGFAVDSSSFADSQEGSIELYEVETGNAEAVCQ